MLEHKKVGRKNQEESDHKHHVRQKDYQELSDQLQAWDTDFLSFNSPFVTRTDDHAALLAKATSNEARKNLVLGLQRTYGNQYVQHLIGSVQRQNIPEEEIQMQLDDNLPVIFSEDSQKDKTNRDQIVIQREWSGQEVNNALQKGAAGVRAELIRGGYRIFKYDTLTIRKRVGGIVSEGNLHGYHCRSCRMIGIKADETPQSAAATIVHESQHAQQYTEREANEREDWDLIKREYEAHIREEQFRKAHNEPPKKPEFRDRNNNINIKAIKKWVKANYSKKTVERLYPTGHENEGKPISKEDLRHIHNLATNQIEVTIW